MRKKRIMIIGPSRCGKTTLANKFNEKDGPAKRTADVIYGKKTIDIPSAYLENTWMYKNIIALSQDAFAILLLIDSSRIQDIYSPLFAKSFKCPVIGVVTKGSLKDENMEVAKKKLKLAGVKEPFFYIDYKEECMLQDLKSYLCEICKE